MPEGVEFPFPSLLFYEGRTYGQPEVVRISLPQVATGLRLRLPAPRSVGGHFMQTCSCHRRHSSPEAHSMQAVMQGTLTQRAFRQILFSFRENVTCRKSAGYAEREEKRIMAIFHYTVNCWTQQGKSIISASALSQW